MDCHGMPSSLTPRLVRSEVETKLELSSGTLDSPAYKALVKRTIHDAMVCTFFLFVLKPQTKAICDDNTQQREQTSGVSGKTDGKMSRNASKLKAGESGHSSASKSIKSKVRKIDLTDCMTDSPSYAGNYYRL